VRELPNKNLALASALEAVEKEREWVRQGNNGRSALDMREAVALADAVLELQMSMVELADVGQAQRDVVAELRNELAGVSGMRMSVEKENEQFRAEVERLRDVVAAQDKALRRIAAIKDQHTWSEDDALEAAEIAAAVVSGTPPQEEEQ
jgi:ATP-dependent Clp protease ATP-binding subunit ClpA